MEFANLLPPNSHGEPTPADKDPVPDPFDNTYNVPEHDEFVVKVKYIRDDRFVVGESDRQRHPGAARTTRGTISTRRSSITTPTCGCWPSITRSI